MERGVVGWVVDWVACMQVVGMRLTNDIITEILYKPAILIGSILSLICSFVFFGIFA